MATDVERGPNIRDLEGLRIVRAGEAPRRMRLVPILTAAGIAAVLVAGGLAAYRYTLGRPLEVETASVTARSAGQSGVLLTGSGYVITRAKYITIGTKILGQIVAEPIEEGKHVKKGELLAQIDNRDYVAQLDQAQADHALALADLKLQEAKARRIRSLFQKGYASRDELDVVTNGAEVARARVKRAEASIDFAKFMVSQTTIRSPIDGVVLQKYREVGATINYGGEIQAGGGATDIVQLADTDDMRVEIDINESDIGKVKIEMPASIVADAYPDRSFAAKVVKIYPEANRQKGTVKVEARFEHPDMTVIKPEMSAKVSFLASGSDTTQSTQVLVPKKAIVGANNAASVWVVRDGEAERVPVTLGGEFQDGVEVRQGLSGGETVIISPPEHLHAHQAVVEKAS
jgi:RND family efflux transporter MFP subunit